MIALGKNSKKPLRHVCTFITVLRSFQQVRVILRGLTIDQSMYGAPVLFVDILK